MRVAINGFGRIGRTFIRAVYGGLRYRKIEIVAINDLSDTKTLAHLLKYDSVHRRFPAHVSYDDTHLIINERKIKVCAEKDPARLPWRDLGVEYVLESTGHFRDIESASKHLEAGADKVIISAPAKGNIPTVVMGINHTILRKEDRIVSNASCTTNCAAPMLLLLDQIAGIESAFISTVHSYTGDQRLHDAPHSDLRRARAAAVSIVPTTTGAAKALGEIFPHLKGKLGGAGIRVPVSDGSLTDISCVVKKNVSVEEINAYFKQAASTTLNGILEYTEEPLVSVDIIGNSHSCIFDAEMTTIVGGIVKVIGWYDNEMGYSSRLCDLLLYMDSLS